MPRLILDKASVPTPSQILSETCSTSANNLDTALLGDRVLAPGSSHHLVILAISEHVLLPLSNRQTFNSFLTTSCASIERDKSKDDFKANKPNMREKAGALAHASRVKRGRMDTDFSPGFTTSRTGAGEGGSRN